MTRGQGYRYGPAYGTDAQRLTGKYITPFFWKAYQFFCFWLIAAFLLWLIYMWGISDWSKEGFFFLIGLAVVSSIASALKIPVKIARSLFGPRIDVVVGADWVKVGGWLTYKTYYASQYGFAVEPHEKAEQEAAFEHQNPAKARKKPGLYRHTKQIVLYIGATRIAIASIYFAPLLANGIVAQLNLLKQEVISQQMTG